MKGIPDLPKVPQNCHVGVMSGDPGSVGRGYMPPAMPAPAQYAQRLRHPPPASHQPWPSSPGMVGGLFGSTQVGAWQSKPPLFGLALVQQGGLEQSESMDLSASRPEQPTLRNGEKSPPSINGQVKEASVKEVSVIATNPLRPEEPSITSGVASNEGKEGRGNDVESLLEDMFEEEGAVSVASAPSAPTPVASSESLVIPTPTVPSTPSTDAVPPTPIVDHVSTPVHVSPGATASNTPGAVPSVDSASPAPVEPSTPTAVPTPLHEPTPPVTDTVEFLLENMFQPGPEEASVPQSVIVTNSARQPALTEDKVVAILEDKMSVVEEVGDPEKTVDKVKEEVKEEEIGKEMVASLEEEVKEEPKNPYIQVESELEKMFAGIVEPSTEDSMPGNIKTEVKRTKRKAPRAKGKKLPENGAKRAKKRFDGGEKKGAKQHHQTQRGGRLSGGLMKEGSNDSCGAVVRSRGPFVHIEGSREAPALVEVVNSGSREEEERDRGVDRRKTLSTRLQGRVKGPGLYNSTLSTKYNSNNVDTSWVCVFCKKRPHTPQGLGGEAAGDLFGPYVVRICSEEPLAPGTPSDREVAEEQKKRGGGRQLSLRAAGVASQFTASLSKKKKQSDVDKCVTGGEEEVWVHEQCAVWAPGVVLVGPHLIGLDEAISQASFTRCSGCGDTGAGLGCVVRGCPTRCHYGCAITMHWSLDHDTFIAKCPSHKHKLMPVGGGYVTLGMVKQLPA